MIVRWKTTPDPDTYPAALSYLSLLMPAQDAATLVDRLQAAKAAQFQAKDILRASGLRLLPTHDADVAAALMTVRQGGRLSPVLLVRGGAGGPLVIADGYHRVCASCQVDENTDVSCRIVDPI